VIFFVCRWPQRNTHLPAAHFLATLNLCVCGGGAFDIQTHYKHKASQHEESEFVALQEQSKAGIMHV
jgi:hypothetical protein